MADPKNKSDNLKQDRETVEANIKLNNEFYEENEANRPTTAADMRKNTPPD
jgi:hypothetical protein